MEKKKKVLFISSTGGHLSELLRLSPMFEKYDYHIVTEQKDANFDLEKKYEGHVDFLSYGTKKNMLTYPFRLIYNAFKSLKIYLRFRPDVIITTGTHTAGAMCIIGKLFRSNVIYIETLANIKTKTQTGRIIYHFADLFIVQWEEMLKVYPKAKYWGRLY